MNKDSYILLVCFNMIIKYILIIGDIMKKYDILPTNENLKKSIEKNVTDRNQNIYQLLKLLNYQEESWSIAINGDWGSGKTFFVKQCKYILDRLNEYDPELTESINLETIWPNNKLEEIRQKPYRTLYYDAWEHDNDLDPIQSVLKCILSADWMSNVKDVAKKVATVGLSILQAVTPVDTKDLKNFLNDSSKSLDLLKKQFNQVLGQLVPDKGRLVIFIDELDRCKPTYAVKLLERIKHYFTNENITFIFSVDLGQLKNTVQNYYGDQFDGYSYLDRFFDLVINLPEPNMETYLNNTGDILVLNEIFKTEDNYPNHFCKYLIKQFSFSLRQINHFYLKTNSAAYNLIENITKGSFLGSRQNGDFFVYSFILPLMCALNQADISEYTKFIKGQASKSTLNILATNSEFKRYYKDIIYSSKEQKNVEDFVNTLYNAIFNDTEEYDRLEISDEASIEYLSLHKKALINACSLLDSNVKFD